MMCFCFCITLYYVTVNKLIVKDIFAKKKNRKLNEYKN